MKKRSGITLIEVILSIAIIGIIAITIFGAFAIGITNIGRAGKRTESVLLANDYIDKAILNVDTINLYPNEDEPIVFVDILNDIRVGIPGVGDILIDGKIIESTILFNEDTEIKIQTFITD